MGFGYFVAETALKRPVALSARLAWAGFYRRHRRRGRSLLRYDSSAGRATVLFTFYPPLDREPLVLCRPRSRRCLIVGLVRAHADRRWDNGNARIPVKSVPLAMFATTANAVLMALDHRRRRRGDSFLSCCRPRLAWTECRRCRAHANPVFLDPARHRLFLARFRLTSPSTRWRRKSAGGRLYSDLMARISFVAFLIYGLPVGIASPLHGSASRDRLQSRPDGSDGAGRRSDAADGVHRVRVDGDRRTLKGRQRPARLGRRTALARTPRPCHGPVVLHALVRRLRRAHQYELRHERHGP
jgi:hypothetical protein